MAEIGDSGLVAEEKKVSWAELYFDVIFVFALTQVSSFLRHDLNGGGLWRALLLFTAIYWGWVGTSIHGNTHDLDTVRGRLVVFSAGFCGLVMALGSPMPSATSAKSSPLPTSRCGSCWLSGLSGSAASPPAPTRLRSSSRRRCC